MPRRDPVPPMHTCIQTHPQNHLIISKNSVGSKKKVSLREKEDSTSHFAKLCGKPPLHVTERGGEGAEAFDRR